MNELASPSLLKAIVYGKELAQIPADLFIPPNALEVLLESFSGPLDLLLYLIRKQNINIMDIPIVSITHQYLAYIDLMETHKLELAADYLVMAAMLAEIKSRLLLPTYPNHEEEEEDPRMGLVRKLQQYEQIKQGADLLDALPRKERDHFLFYCSPPSGELAPHPDVLLDDLIHVMRDLLQKEDHRSHHQIVKEIMSVRERMSLILLKLQQYAVIEFSQLLIQDEGRKGLVVTFLAILELARQSLITLTQTQAFCPIHLRVA